MKGKKLSSVKPASLFTRGETRGEGKVQTFDLILSHRQLVFSIFGPELLYFSFFSGSCTYKRVIIFNY